MADTLALGASAVRHGGSSPLPCTVIKRRKGVFLCTGEDLKDGLSEGEGGGVAGFFSRKIPVTKPLPCTVDLIFLLKKSTIRVLK